MRKILGLLVAAISLSLPARIDAQDYPARPVRLIVPFAAGGPLDMVARAVADKLSASLKQSFVIDNRAGAGGNLGTELVARAAPDGHTLLLTLGTALTVNPSLYRQLPFDVAKDLRPISILTSASQMLVVHPSVPVHSVADFVAQAKKEPIAYAHAGHGSPGHLAMEYFGLTAGFKGTPVPYRGNAPLVNDLIGGQIKHAFVSSAGVIPQMREGRLRGLAISAARRSPAAPDVPTIAESGYPGFEVETYFVLLGPARLPDPIATLLETEVRQALRVPELQERFGQQDIRVVVTSGAEAQSRLAADTTLWARVVRDADMKAE
jgi:tripartite-type tricarboxylate transporter receptor subunit TctC